MSKRLTTEEFIERAKQIHGDKYDYSKVEYINNKTKVCIICRTHGEFWQIPNYHIDGCGCPECGGTIKKTFDDFLLKAKKIHGKKYNYDLVEYKNITTPIKIICHTHGEFYQTPRRHLMGRGCQKCGGTYKSSTEEFITRARQVHGDIYDYSKVEYANSSTKVCIICPTHGEFWQIPSDHLLNKSSCPMCNGRYVNDTETFIKRAREIHGDKYDYSKVTYEKTQNKVCIICPIHGEFWQRPLDHLHKQGCPECGGTNKLTFDGFVTRAREIHGDKYDYSKVDLTNRINGNKVNIICPNHGPFIQNIQNHLFGNGCPICSTSVLERDINQILHINNIFNVYEYKATWLGKQSLDFFIPSKNIAIECQGLQHFKSCDYFGGDDVFKKQVERDERKRKLCEEQGIKLLYYSNLGIDYPYQVYEDKEELLKEILK